MNLGGLFEALRENDRATIAAATLSSAPENGAVATSPRVAIVVGGGNCVLDDLERARKLCEGYDVTYFVVNDMIPIFNFQPMIAVTLHAAKIEKWLADRKRNGLPPPRNVWSMWLRKETPSVDRVSDDWGGSSGLYSYKIARELGFEKIILVGVPMDVMAMHFTAERRNKAWGDCTQFRKVWVKRHDEIKNYVRSMSGWTLEKLGAPTREWIDLI